MTGAVIEQTPRAEPEPTGQGRAAPRHRLLRELFAAAAGSCLLAVLMTWPTVRHLSTRYASTGFDIEDKIHDPLLMMWQLAWPGYALSNQPLDPWQANVFYPEPDSFAFTDSLFGYAPLSLFGTGPTAAVIRYNVVFVLIAAMAFFGAYVLARQLGSRWPGAVVAGAAFAYAPWRLGHVGHLHVLSTGGIALALAALARGHGYSLRTGYRREAVRPGWALVGWALAAWQVTIGFGIGVPFAYVLVLIGVCAAVGWALTGRPGVPGRLILADLGGGVAFAAVALLMARPYLQVVERYPDARRSVKHLVLYSPPARGLFTAPADSWLWGDAHAAARATMPDTPETALLPGFVLLALALLGLLFGVWRLRYRIALALGAVASAAYAMGTQLAGGEFTYLPLYRHLPGMDAIRTPGRLVIWTTLCLCLLAAAAVTALHDRLSPRGPDEGVDDRAVGRRSARWPRWAAAALVLPTLLILVEGANRTPHPTAPRQPDAMRDLAGPALVLPSHHQTDKKIMFWSTDGFPKLVNGESGWRPPAVDRARRVSLTFPDAASVEYLRAHGVRTVVVLRELSAGTPWARLLTAPVDGLPVQRVETADAVVFTLEQG